MKMIPLTKGKAAIVDDGDHAWLAQWKWHAAKDHKTFYAVRSIDGGSKKVKMHRLILNAPDGVKLDHRDLNGLNNQRSNLRLATNSQSGANRGMQSNNTSGSKGVMRYRGKWRASITVNNRTIYLGDFPVKSLAVSAYMAAAQKHFGEFANLQNYAY